MKHIRILSCFICAVILLSFAVNAETEVYSVGSALLSYESDKAMLNVSAAVANSSNGTAEAMLYAAVYSNSGMIGIAGKSVSLTEYYNERETVSVNIPDLPESYSVKVFLFINDGSLQPLCENAETERISRYGIVSEVNSSSLCIDTGNGCITARVSGSAVIDGVLISNPDMKEDMQPSFAYDTGYLLAVNGESPYLLNQDKTQIESVKKIQQGSYVMLVEDGGGNIVEIDRPVLFAKYDEETRAFTNDGGHKMKISHEAKILHKPSLDGDYTTLTADELESGAVLSYLWFSNIGANKTAGTVYSLSDCAAWYRQTYEDIVLLEKNERVYWDDFENGTYGYFDMPTYVGLTPNIYWPVASSWSGRLDIGNVFVPCFTSHSVMSSARTLAGVEYKEKRVAFSDWLQIENMKEGNRQYLFGKVLSIDGNTVELETPVQTKDGYVSSFTKESDDIKEVNPGWFVKDGSLSNFKSVENDGGSLTYTYKNDDIPGIYVFANVHDGVVYSVVFYWF